MKKQQGVVFDVSELADGPPMPITTVGGIMQRIQESRARARKSSGKPVQCSSTFSVGARTTTTTFCELDEGHEGEHRQGRKRWPNDNRRSPHPIPETKEK